MRGIFCSFVRSLMLWSTMVRDTAISSGVSWDALCGWLRLASVVFLMSLEAVLKQHRDNGY